MNTKFDNLSSSKTLKKQINKIKIKYIKFTVPVTIPFEFNNIYGLINFSSNIWKIYYSLEKDNTVLILVTDSIMIIPESL